MNLRSSEVRRLNELPVSVRPRADVYEGLYLECRKVLITELRPNAVTDHTLSPILRVSGPQGLRM